MQSLSPMLRKPLTGYHHLKLLDNLKKKKRGTSHFYFVLGPANHDNEGDYNDNNDYYLKKKEKETELGTSADLKLRGTSMIASTPSQFSRPTNHGSLRIPSTASRVVCLEHKPHHSIQNPPVAPNILRSMPPAIMNLTLSNSPVLVSETS